MINPSEVPLSNFRVGTPNPFNGGSSDPRLVDHEPISITDLIELSNTTIREPQKAYYPYGDPDGKLRRHIAKATFLFLAGWGIYEAVSDKPAYPRQSHTPTPTTIYTASTPTATPITNELGRIDG